MSGTLSKVRDSLEDRRINRFDKLLNRRKAPFIKLKERQRAFFKSFESSEDQAEKKLRGGWDKRGGNRRSKPAWRNKTILKEYAQLVEERLALAKQIKYVFNRCDGADEWMEDLEKDRAYKLLAEGVAPEIIAWARKQIASVYLPPDVREPQAIACEMARQELGLDKPNDIGTLQGYFRQGIGLLKSEQTRPKQ